MHVCMHAPARTLCCPRRRTLREALSSRGDLLGQITRERDAAVATVGELKEDIARHKRVLSDLQHERAQALSLAAATRQRASQQPHQQQQPPEQQPQQSQQQPQQQPQPQQQTPTMADLQAQNESLRSVVREMRKVRLLQMLQTQMSRVVYSIVHLLSLVSRHLFVCRRWSRSRKEK